MDLYKIISAMLLIFLVGCNGSSSNSNDQVLADTPEIDISPNKIPKITADTPTLRSGYTATKYPIVLAHGLFGWDEIDFGITGINLLSYFFTIPEELERSGAKVHVTQVSAANSNEIRGEQFLQQVEEFLEENPQYEKVNLIGHSQGATSVRYVAAVRPEIVASVTTIGGANQDSPIFNSLVIIANLPIIGTTINAVIDGLLWLTNIPTSGFCSDGQLCEQDIKKAMEALSTKGMNEFNSRFPQALPTNNKCGNGPNIVNGIRYYSWSGNAAMTNPIDMVDWLFILTSSILEGPDDGIIPQCVSHLGKIIRDDYKLNHLDQTNQFYGMTGRTSPIAVWRTHANRLKNDGL